MSKFLKATVVVNQNSNRLELHKGMSVEFMSKLSGPGTLADRDKEVICKLLEEKYNAKCDPLWFKKSMIEIEEL
jgi:hypothetical protein